MAKSFVEIIFWGLVALTLFTTLAPLTSSDEWWIRGWDFPRLHIAVVALVTAGLGMFLGRKITLLATVMLLACCVYQTYRIFPYTPLATREVQLQEGVALDDQISLISVNVLMENTNYAATADLIEQERPDVLFLMETDQMWADALAPALAGYGTVLSHPLDNHYGLIFATNLTVHDAEIVFMSDDNTPAVLADLEGPAGRFFFVGLHPRPPVPGQDTTERDTQIRRAAQLADREKFPVVAMGDFNDVAWSYTSERFKEFGEFKDPRIGRGMLPSFNATSWWMRFPIDQFYLTEGVGLISFDRLGEIGSDHFPMKAVITLNR